MSKKSAPTNTGGNKGGGNFTTWFGAIVGFALAFAFLLPTTVLCIAGLLPTIVMLVVDPAPDRRGALAVGALNIAGVLPFLISLWHHANTLETAVGYLAQPICWLIMYGAASIGYGIYNYMPKAIAIFSGLRAQSEIASRKNIQKQLLDRWGNAITSNASIDELESL